MAISCFANANDTHVCLPMRSGFPGWKASETTTENDKTQNQPEESTFFAEAFAGFADKLQS